MEASSLPNASSTTWRESPGADEAAEIERLARAINGYQRLFADRGDGRPRRAFHVKSHAGMHATFAIVDEVPEKARFGVFAVPRSFNAWVRFSNGFSAGRADWWPDLLGMSVRLTGVDGPRVMDDAAGPIQDFIALNQTLLPADNGEQLFVISTAVANLLTAPWKVVRSLGFAHALRVAWWSLGLTWHRLWTNSVATETYYSNVPITIGPHAVKFKWQPRGLAAPGFAGPLSGANYLRRDLERRLAGGEIVFDFMVQFYKDPATTPIDGATEWKASDAPYLKFAELTVGQSDLAAAAAHEDEQYLEGAAFNTWHALVAHRPIGNVQRTRRAVYLSSSRFRGSWE